MSMFEWKVLLLKYYNIWFSCWMVGCCFCCVKAYGQLVPNQSDLAFQEWCSDVANIYINKNVHLVTTDQSVAGRGLFAKETLEEGDIVLSIPSQVILSTNYNIDTNKEEEEENSWKVELTNVVYNILHNEDDDIHPWKEWMELWHRDDDVHDWYQNKCTNIKLLAYSLHHKYSVPYNEVLVALQIRKNQYEYDYSTTMFVSNDDDDDDEWSRLYSLVSSRAITLPLPHHDENNVVVGIVPMQDMINHHPFHCNLAMEYNQEWDRLEIFVTKSIVPKNDELFISYTTTTNANDDVSIQQIWNLIQWGIPPTTSAKSYKAMNNEKNTQIMT